MTVVPDIDAFASQSGRKSLSPAVQARIGQGLKAIYDEVANEPIPDELLRLLERLEAEHTKKTK